MSNETYENSLAAKIKGYLETHTYKRNRQLLLQAASSAPWSTLHCSFLSSLELSEREYNKHVPKKQAGRTEFSPVLQDRQTKSSSPGAAEVEGADVANNTSVVALQTCMYLQPCHHQDIFIEQQHTSSVLVGFQFD